MIKRYFDFINESLEFILESDVIYSDKFRFTLSKIDDPISKSILDIENKDLTVQSNYFDITMDKNDTVSFIPDRKAQEILKDVKEFWRFDGSGGGWLKHSEANTELFSKLGYVPEGSPYGPNSRDIGEIVAETVSETSGKTYCWVKFNNNSGEYVGQGVYNKERLTKAPDAKEKEVWLCECKSTNITESYCPSCDKDIYGIKKSEMNPLKAIDIISTKIELLSDSIQ